MSSSDRLLLIFHIGFAIFSLGPLTAATSVTPRYIRRQNIAVLRYLNRTTRIYGLLTLGILLFGLFLADGDFARVWLTASITLYVVALVLLLIVERDQRKAVHLLELAAVEAGQATPELTKPEAEASSEDEPEKGEEKRDEPERPVARTDVAEVERGRIAAMSGVIALIWVVILFMMVWWGR